MGGFAFKGVNRWLEYERRKRMIVAATSAEYEAAIKRILKELNL